MANQTPTVQELQALIIALQGQVTALQNAAPAAPAEPPRLTTTPWFKRKHHEVPAKDWQDDKVRSPANCAACHTRAAAGSYREREIVMPNGRRWEEKEDD